MIIEQTTGTGTGYSPWKMAFGILSTVYGAKQAKQNKRNKTRQNETRQTSAKQEKQMSIEFVIHAALNTIE